MTKEVFESEPFTRLKDLNYLQRTGQVNNELFWTPLIEEAETPAASA